MIHAYTALARRRALAASLMRASDQTISPDEERRLKDEMKSLRDQSNKLWLEQQQLLDHYVRGFPPPVLKEAKEEVDAVIARLERSGEWTNSDADHDRHTGPIYDAAEREIKEAKAEIDRLDSEIKSLIDEQKKIHLELQRGGVKMPSFY